MPPPPAGAHQNYETGAAETGATSAGYSTPAPLYGMTFGNPKMRVHLQHNSGSYAYDTGYTSTSAYIEWDVSLSPAPQNCYWMPYHQIEIQKRDLDAAGAPLTSWRTFNYTSHQGICLNAAEGKHWGPDSLGMVHQGGLDFEMRLRDSATGAVYLTATGPGSFYTPTAPTSLLVKDITTASVTVEWLNNANRSSSTEIYRMADPGGPWTRVATIPSGGKNRLTSYTDTTVTSGADYRYRVRAVNGTAVSGWSNEAATRAGIIDRERTYGDSLGENPSGELGDPVNTLTGSFTTSVTDLSLPGIGLPLVFTRSYNSADTAAGKLGVGWTHPFETSLSISSTRVRVRGSDGQRMLFTKQSDGSYRGEPGARATLTAMPGAFEVTHYDGLVERFDTYGQLWAVRDANGNKLQMGWSGNMTSITDTAGRTATLAYNGSGLLSGVTLADGRSVGFSYTPGGMLEKVTDLRGGVTTYTYDGARRLEKIIDQSGNAIVTNTYGANGRVTKQVNARNHEWLYAWDANTQTASVTDPRGNVYKDVYSGNVLRRRIDPLGNVTALDYDGDLNVTALTDPRGKTTTMTYDSRGNMLTRTAPAPLSYQESWTYGSRNLPTSYTNGRQFTTTYQYDAKGNLDLVTQPGNILTDYAYNVVTGQLTSVTDPRSKTTYFRYDAMGNLTQTERPSGALTTFGYDSSGRMTSTVEPRGNVTGANPNDFKTVFTYNAANQLTNATNPLGHSSSTSYDAAGRVTSVTDAKSRTTSYGYNATNLVTSVTAPDATVTGYTYDPAGNLVSRTDANNHTVSYTYDAAGRLTGTTLPMNRRWEYTYDAASNVTTATDAIGTATAQTGDGMTAFDYDAMGRMKAIDYSDQTPDVTFGYDANGNRISMTDGAGTEAYQYDDNDRLTHVTRGGDVFSYDYDAGSNLTRRTYPDGTVFDLAYDLDGRLDSVTTASATTNFDYDAAGNLTTKALPATNGHVEERTYDRAGRLTAIENTKGSVVLSAAAYVRDAVGNPTKVMTTTETTTYDYDALDRLKEACYQMTCATAADPFIRYTYDGVGNRLTETRPDATTTYDYNAADQLTSATTSGVSTTYQYDLNGNMTTAGQRSFSYDAVSRLTSTTSGSETVDYTYDGVGKRLSAASGNSSVTKFLWDKNATLPQLALERDGTGAPPRRYEYGAGLISLTAGGEAGYYHFDGLGSVTDITDAAGGSDWSFSYEPFGAARTQTKLDPAAPGNPMRFTGEYLDTTGMYHLRARQYSPEVGRFVSADAWPLTAAQPAVSTYAYVNNRPMFLVDPSGFCGWTDPLDCVADVANAVGTVADVVAVGAAAVAVGAAVVVTAPVSVPIAATVAGVAGSVALTSGYVSMGSHLVATGADYLDGGFGECVGYDFVSNGSGMATGGAGMMVGKSPWAALFGGALSMGVSTLTNAAAAECENNLGENSTS